jgi:hypothetical protein
MRLHEIEPHFTLRITMEETMRNLRFGVAVLWLLTCCAVTPASAEVSIGIGLPNVRIGINLPLYPELVPVPGYPVYYAPRLDANYFFYDGMYWVYWDDYWYASYWYNGPWWLIEPDGVPLFILRIPVRYYRHPPLYFRGWRANAPPRWGEHWGRDWEQHRKGWNKWKRGTAPARAPLPAYQRQYTGDRYPRQVEQQQKLRQQHYRYQPRDKAVRQHFQQRSDQKPPLPAQRGKEEEHRMKAPGQPEIQRPAPRQHGTPVAPPVQQQHQVPPPQRGPVFQEQGRPPGAEQRERQAPSPQGREQMKERVRPQEPGRGHGEGQRMEEERGRER